MAQGVAEIDAATAVKRKKTVIWVVALCLLGMIFDGYDLVVYGAVMPQFFRPDTGGLIFNALPEHQEVFRALAAGAIDKTVPEALAAQAAGNAIAGQLGSYALVGVMVGALLSGTLGDIIGRRKVMLSAIVIFSLAMFVTSFTTDTTTFGILRFITGMGAGAFGALAGAVVSEFALPGRKQLANAIVYSGVALGSLLSALLAILLLNTIQWQGVMRIGALPLLTVLPLAIWKMPESVAWLASRGKIDRAREISEKTGIPLPEPALTAQPRANEAPVAGGEGRAGWPGLFRDFPLPTIILGLMSVAGLLLIYLLNTWLPRLMEGTLGQSGSLALLLVLNGGAVIGGLIGSRFADRFGPQPTVAVCFGLGAVALFLLTVVPDNMVGLLLLMIAIVGLGTSGTQALIFGFVANYYRTNVRAAGVAWAAGFGRLGGIFGPILVTVDRLGNEPTRRRVTEFVKLNGTKAYLGYIADERIIGGEAIGSTILADGGGDARVTEEDIASLQEYVDRLTVEGVSAEGVIISAGEHDRGDKIMSLADELGVDLVILKFEHGGARAKARTAQQILHHNPKIAVLVARPTTDAALV